MLLEELEEALADILPSGFTIKPNKKGEMVIMTGLLLNREGELIGVDEDQEDADYDSESDEDSLFENDMNLEDLSDVDDEDDD